MKLFSLEYHGIEYVVVFANTFEEACLKAEKRTGIKAEEWKGEEFKQGMYDDVLYFC